MIDISVTAPIHNEEESIPFLCEKLHNVLSKLNKTYEIVLVDDGSTDSSWNVLLEQAKKYPCLKLIKFRKNFGQTAAMSAGIKESSGEIVITLDADLQNDPEDIPAMLAKLDEGFDVVCGWRKDRKDTFVNRKLPSMIANRLIAKMTGVKIHDNGCSLKAYRREVIGQVNLYGEMHRYIPILAKYAGFKRIGEKVVEHHERKYGHSKFGLERMVKGYLDLISVTFMSHFGRSPMYIFGGLGTLMFLLGFVAIVWIIVEKFAYAYPITNQPLFYLSLTAIVIGVQLFLAGFIGELVNRRSSDRNHYLVDEQIE